MRTMLVFLALMLVSALATAQTLDADQEARYWDMVHELRCAVCQNQTIAESNAPLAKDLRDQVRKQIAEGQSDEQIRDYMTDRYSDFVLYRPPFEARTLLIWFGPALVLLVALIAALRYARRSASQPRRPPADPDELRRLLDRHS